jgi:hypothetical protein
LKRSTEIYANLQIVLQRIRGLNAEVEANQPIRRDWRLSDAENNENRARSARLDELSIAIGNAELEAKRLRKAYSDAMADEQQPPPAAPAKSMAEVPKLRKQIADAEASIANLLEQRRPHVVAAARGDKKALAALDQIAAIEDTATNRIEIVKAAIAEIEAQNAEERREVVERDADSRFAAAQRVAEEISTHDRNIDLTMRALAEHLAQRSVRLRALRKTGATFDDARVNVLSTVEILHRAAKAAGLAELLGITVRDAVPLEDASRTLLKLAIRRPEVARAVA